MISSGQIELLRSNYLVEDIFLYYRSADHVESTIDAAIKTHTDETINGPILNFHSGSASDNHYLETLKNPIHFRIHLIEKQLEWYSSQRDLAEKLIKKINGEIHFIKTVC